MFEYVDTETCYKPIVSSSCKIPEVRPYYKRILDLADTVSSSGMRSCAVINYDKGYISLQYSKEFADYAEKVYKVLKEKGYDTTLDNGRIVYVVKNKEVTWKRKKCWYKQDFEKCKIRS